MNINKNLMEEDLSYKTALLNQWEAKVVGYYLFKALELVQDRADTYSIFVLANVLNELLGSHKERESLCLEDYITAVIEGIPEADEKEILCEIEDGVNELNISHGSEGCTHDEVLQNNPTLIKIVYLQRCVDKQIFFKILHDYIFSKASAVLPPCETGETIVSEQFSLQDLLPQEVQTLVRNMDELEFLRKKCNFSENELRYIHFLYYKARFNELGTVVQELENYLEDGLPQLLDIPLQEYEKIIYKTGELKRFDSFVYDNSLNQDYVQLIFSKDYESYFDNMVLKPKRQPLFDLEDFQLPPQTQELTLRLLQGKSPVSMMIYERLKKPLKFGCRYTETQKDMIELSFALAKAAKLRLIFFDASQANRNIARNKILSRLELLFTMSRSKDLIVIVNADALFGRYPREEIGGEKKLFIKPMMKNFRGKILWHVHCVRELPMDFIQRQNMSIAFEKLNKCYIHKNIEKNLSQCNLPDSMYQQVYNLFVRYDVRDSLLKTMVSTIKNFGPQSENIVGDLEFILKQNKAVYDGTDTKEFVMDSTYEPEVLNTSISAEQIASMVKNARLYDSKMGIRILFYGASGTGKTAFARYLSQVIGKTVLVKKASDILDRYVGESEQRIKKAFEEAKQSDSVLIFDEADTFFTDRSRATRSWELNLVNEFLTQMEDFDGIVICTTNLRKIMDPAMNRRFHLMVEFSPLTQEGIEILLKKFFGNFDFTPENIQELSQYNSLTPGDFNTLSERLLFLSEEDRTASYIMQELVAMQKEKQSSDVSFQVSGFTA